MHTDELLESCLQALSNGQEIPHDIARYLARHPQQRAEIEELIFIAQRAAQLPPAELSVAGRTALQERLAARMGVDPSYLDLHASAIDTNGRQEQPAPGAGIRAGKWRLLARGHWSLARLRYSSASHSDEEDEAAARIRIAFRDLTPEDIRRYIGDRGEDYLYYRQRFPQWELVFAFLAAVLRGFKRLEKLANFYS